MSTTLRLSAPRVQALQKPPEVPKKVNSQPRTTMSYDDAVVALEELLAMAQHEEWDEDTLREEIEELGFDSESATIKPFDGGRYKVMVWGPKNTIIQL